VVTCSRTSSEVSDEPRTRNATSCLVSPEYAPHRAGSFRRRGISWGASALPGYYRRREERDQKNVYLAGHRLGFPNTGSRLVFYNLDKLKNGDSIVLEDSLGDAYEYRVSEVFVVEPDADWVVDPVRGRDMVTLQTCTFPDLLNRLIVRADRV
jgi:sortase A